MASLDGGQLGVQRAQVAVLQLRRLAQGADRVALEVGQRVRVVGRGELPHQVGLEPDHRLAHQRADLVLHRLRGAIGEQPVEPPVELLAQRSRALGELAVELPGRLLHLRRHELGVRAGLLAVEHARADLDRVGHQAGRVLTPLLALAHQARGGRIVDHQPVHGDALAGEDADVRWTQWRGGFHGTLQRRRRPRRIHASARRRRGM
ncbi:MAG: hypothetical protein E6G30_09125 [Actinobacteria bacterium]|nr:MAG: hypothetical protein E6G30_09125 [Actinomycetota bacterium]